MTAASGKKTLRARARARRAALAATMPDHAARLAFHAGALNLSADAIVGGYAALPGEANPALLLTRLHEQGHALALPRIAEKDAALAFHRWKPGMALTPGVYGVPEPDPSWPQALPSVILVPLLAFDAAGYRLGYGGGYYDRTLAALRVQDPILAIGVAYAGQEMEELPHDGFDAGIDLVLTELGLRGFKKTP